MQTLEEILKAALLRMEDDVPANFEHLKISDTDRDIVFVDLSDELAVYLDFNIFDLIDHNKAQIYSDHLCVKFWLFGDLKMSEMVKVGDMWFHNLEVFPNGDMHVRFYQLNDQREIAELDPIVIFPYGGGFTTFNIPEKIDIVKLIQFIDYFIATARIKFSRMLK